MSRAIPVSVFVCFVFGCGNAQSPPAVLVTAPDSSAAANKAVVLREFLIPHKQVINCVAVSPNGEWGVAGTLSGAVLFFDLRKQEAAQVLQMPNGNLLDSAVISMAFSADGGLLFVGCADGGVRGVKFPSGQVAIQFHKHRGPIRSLTLIPNSAHLLSGSTSDYAIYRWEQRSGKEVRCFQAKESPESVAVSPEGATFISSEFCDIQLWDIASGARLRTFRGHSSRVKGVFFFNNGGRIVSVSLGEIRVWNVDDGTLLAKFGDDDFFVDNVALSSDGRYLLLGLTGESQLWDVTSQVRLCSMKGLNGMTCVAFSPGGNVALIGEMWGRLRLWQLPVGKSPPG